jgi:hypothetical protein
MRRIYIVASLVLALPAVAAAQHAGTAGGGATAAAPAAHAMAPVSAPHTVAAHPAVAGHVATGAGGIHHTPRANATATTTATPVRRFNIASGLRNLPLFSFSSSDVPGLGFDYAHLAAVNPAFTHQRPFFNSTGGFGFGGFLLMSPGYVVEEPVVEGQPVPGEEEAAANSGAPETRDDVSDQFLPAQALPPAPQPDAAEYVFVRRDGTLVFAVAYYWDNGTLRYVAADGTKRSISQDALDLDATQQFNEQRGLSFRTPA